MTNLTRKQRELLERENLILDVARGMLLERGYLGLTMDRIAEATEYSKGTIYQHFPNKEEIVLALLVQTAGRRTELFERASAFRASPKERIAAVGVAEHVFIQRCPDHFQTEKILEAASIREKTTDHRRAALEACDFRCATVITGIIRDAIAQGDLVLPEGVTPIDVMTGLWTMAWGHYSIVTSGTVLQKVGVVDPLQTLRTNYSMLLDGYGWKPLSSDVDMAALYTRITTEVFPEDALEARPGERP